MMKVTVLMENTSPGSLIHEHGLSLHLSYRGHSVLLDAGSSGRFTDNAAALGVDLSAAEAAALSHGHWDHADGLGAFFACNTAAVVYARPAALLPRYREKDGSYNGVSPALVEQFRGRFDLADGPREILPGLHLIPDSVDHEQSLVAETDRGLVVMNSCCHAGAGYIVKDILARFPGRRVHAIVGGFHLMGHGGTATLGVAPGIVRNLARWLTDELGVELVYTGHCTGAPAFALLQEELGEKLTYLRTGLILDF